MKSTSDKIKASGNSLNLLWRRRRHEKSIGNLQMPIEQYYQNNPNGSKQGDLNFIPRGYDFSMPSHWKKPFWKYWKKSWERS